MPSRHIHFTLSDDVESSVMVLDDTIHNRVTVHTPALTLRTPADIDALIDALIAALREARVALAGDETPGPDPLIEARNAETARMDAGITRALAELPQFTRDFFKHDATPSRVPDAPRSNAAAAIMLGDKLDARDAAPEPPAARSDAPRVRLTRAQREALELLARDGYTLDDAWPTMQPFVGDGKGGESMHVRRSTKRSLLKAGYIRIKSYRECVITDAGREAIKGETNG